MLWEIEIAPTGRDMELKRVLAEYALCVGRDSSPPDIRRTTHGYLVEGDLDGQQARRLMSTLLHDPLVENGILRQLDSANGNESCCMTVLPKPGVMDPVALSVVEAARDLGLALNGVRTFRRYYLGSTDQATSAELQRLLANDAVEEITRSPLGKGHFSLGRPYRFEKQVVSLRQMNDEALQDLSRGRQLSLSLAELKTVQSHFAKLDRDPTDIELETIAQTWSEHCSHKTLKGRINFNGRQYSNLLKETIFEATRKLREEFGADDWCVSVFEDNAGVVCFDESYHVCFKVETHNHPSALEPYGGANTGLGGVIRDPLGTGLGARPICNTDVFCFAPPDTPPESIPEGVLHPRKVITGVVAGVRDYGNRMGIPTVNGAVCFNPRYLANPLVFCGTVGLIPVDRCHKRPLAGDLIVAVGGRTGRDGIHGATFSSIELTSASEQESGGAVQIGNAIFEKKMLDVLLAARDQGLYHAITDCGAGGFSSAVGEMADGLGAHVDLEQAPLKYEGLSYCEIWISEAQERMVLAVPRENWPALESLCRSEDVEATVLGRFEKTGRLRLTYQGNQVGDLDLDFLHDGRPPLVREATWAPTPKAKSTSKPAQKSADYTDLLRRMLAHPDVCSKEWIIRQYDHEVQGATVIKPLVGAHLDGPGDAAVVAPIHGSVRGLAIGCGIQPRLGDLDPYRMAAAAIDEAVRNVVAVGADPERVALLDNFCWGNTDRPEVLGSLVRAAEACRDVALAYRMPFISGKDSLKNEFHAKDCHLVIPPTLLISAMGLVPDIRSCVTMDIKAPGNVLYLLGNTTLDLGGSLYNEIQGVDTGEVPCPDLEMAPRILRALHGAIRASLVRSCHDLSEGGLAVALAEMAFAGGIGLDVVHDPRLGDLSPEAFLFSEAPTRFVLEVMPEDVPSIEAHFQGLPLSKIGTTGNSLHESVATFTAEEFQAMGPHLLIVGDGYTLAASLRELKEAWQKTLRW